MATSSKVGRFKRIANAIATNRAFEGKVFNFHKYATARITGLITSLKIAKHTRNATANLSLSAKTKKTRKTSITVLFTNMARSVKSHGFKKTAKALVTQLAIATRIRGRNKTAGVIQSAAATVTKSKGQHRKGIVTVTYEIGTSRSRTFARKAIATSIGLVRYGLSMIMNVRSVENAQVQPVNDINFYVTPNNPDVVGNYTSENDQPGDFSEPFNGLGEDVVPT
jgi:hypothetical protein